MRAEAVSQRPSVTPPASRGMPLLAVVAGLGLALTAARTWVTLATAVVDTLLLAALLVAVWRYAAAQHGERAAAVAALALVLFAPTLGAVGGGGLIAMLLLTVGLLTLIRCLLDPTVQAIGGAGLCLGLALAALVADGIERADALVWLAVGAAALVVWRVLTAERCEPRRRVVQGAVSGALLTGLIAAAVLAGIGALPSLPEAAEYAHAPPVSAGAPPPAALWLLALNAVPLAVLVGLRPWRRSGRYGDGATAVGLATAVAVAAAHPALLPLLVAPWLALLAAPALETRQVWRLRLVALALVVQALTAALLWPDYPRAADGWTPLPAVERVTT